MSLKYNILDLSWYPTFGIVTIFHNNYLPGHHWAKLKIPDFSWFSSQSWFPSFQQVLTQERALFSKSIWLGLFKKGIWMILGAFWVILKFWPNNYCGLLDLCAPRRTGPCKQNTKFIGPVLIECLFHVSVSQQRITLKVWNWNTCALSNWHEIIGDTSQYSHTSTQAVSEWVSDIFRFHNPIRETWTYICIRHSL